MTDTGGGGGPPSKIDQIVGYRDIPATDNEPARRVPILAHERIVQAMRAGNYLEPACSSAGIQKTVVYKALRNAADLHARAAAQGVDNVLEVPGLERYDRTCVEFAAAVASAEAEWEVHANTQLERIGLGGQTIVTITEKHDAQGNLIERSTRTEEQAPNPQVLEWRLTRRFPARYTTKLELAGGLELSVSDEDAAARLSREVRAFVEQQQAEQPKRRPRKPKS